MFYTLVLDDDNRVIDSDISVSELRAQYRCDFYAKKYGTEKYMYVYLSSEEYAEFQRTGKI